MWGPPRRSPVRSLAPPAPPPAIEWIPTRRRSAEVVQAIREHGAVYFITIGGAAALLAEAVKKKTPVCYEDLGPEAICRLEVENFYAIVGIDSRGNTIIR